MMTAGVVWPFSRVSRGSLVPVYELGREGNGRPYFTMKLVKGQTLASLLQHQTDPVRQRPHLLKVFEQVCQAVAYAHSRRVIHRDLKPSNVMVGAFGEVQVMDWGLAKVLRQAEENSEAQTHPDRPAVSSIVKLSDPDRLGARTQDGDIMGTPAYMPPEQALGELDRLDERCDVFSLGAILCEVLTGHPPYLGPDGHSVLRLARRADLAEAFVRLDGCGADLELVTLAKRCLAAEPVNRPRDAGEVASAVELYRANVEKRALDAERERAGAEARAEEAGARASAERRARHLTVGLALTTLLLVVGVGGGAWWLQRQQASSLARREQTHAKVNAAITVARTLLDESWQNNDVAGLTRARAEADKAVEVAHSGEASSDVQTLADLLQKEAASKLERARQNRDLLTAVLDLPTMGLTVEYRAEGGRMKAVPPLSWDEQVERAFRRWGLEVRPNTTVEDIVARLKDQPPPFVQEVISILDEWVLARRNRRGRPEADWRPLLSAAELLDLNATRREVRRLRESGLYQQAVVADLLRSAVMPWSDCLITEPAEYQRRLRELATRVIPAAERGLAVITLARLLSEVGDNALADDLLRGALATHPRDESLLFVLGQRMENSQPPRLTEAVEYYHAARTLRPEMGLP